MSRDDAENPAVISSYEVMDAIILHFLIRPHSLMKNIVEIPPVR